MNSEVEDWGKNRFGVRLALDSEEIDRLIASLRVLRKDSDQHFHISADNAGEARLADIEVGVLARGQSHNMRITSLALAPGSELPDPTSRSPRSKSNSVRSRLMWAFWAVGIVAGLQATYAAFVTFAAKDHRPILIGGVWASAVALIALHSVTLAAKGWKGRLPGIVGALLVVYVLGEILRRL